MGSAKAFIGYENAIVRVSDAIDGVEKPIVRVDEAVDAVEEAVDGIATPIDGLVEAIDDVRKAIDGVDAAIDGVNGSEKVSGTFCLAGDNRLDHLTQHVPACTHPFATRRMRCPARQRSLP